MEDKQVIANCTDSSRRSFMKVTSVGTALALASSSTELFAASPAQEDTVCTLAVYFQVPKGKLDEFKALVPKLVKRTRSEPGCVHYAFSFNGQIAHCREGYENAAAVLAHLEKTWTRW